MIFRLDDEAPSAILLADEGDDFQRCLAAKIRICVILETDKGEIIDDGSNSLICSTYMYFHELPVMRFEST